MSYTPILTHISTHRLTVVEINTDRCSMFKKDLLSLQKYMRIARAFYQPKN